MISKDKNIFVLNTENTTYVFRVMENGYLEHLYYGDVVDFKGHYQGIIPKVSFPNGNLIVYSENHGSLALELTAQELSTRGKGDVREPMIDVTFTDGNRTCDFVYQSYEIIEKLPLEDMPSAYGENIESLMIRLKDLRYQLVLELTYSVFPESNVITRSSKLINEGKEPVMVERLLSMQLDLPKAPYTVTTFQGAWAREMNKHKITLDGGIFVNDSKAGVSSNRNNPFIMLSDQDTTENAGGCIGCNLIYSGNHYEAVQVGSFHTTRLLTGINPFGFSYGLAEGESLESPEAVLTYASSGFAGVSGNMHEFVRKHIVRGRYQYQERPILINSWEASYFDFNEGKLLKLAKAAKEVGIELFVLDDGWFGNRNDDTSSLGDWTVNKKKLPNGLKGLAEKINKLGMDFGIWVEPEMVNENSQCYRDHPEYAVNSSLGNQALGRHQMILDLTQAVVQEYIIEQISNVLESANITYVKWDMNRVFSDVFSSALEPSKQGEFSHRYILGLYRVLHVLTEKFPQVLFESCASGGNRFDLGMLCYMPQIWASDNTDATSRAAIQSGYSYGYPMSVLSAHVSNSPNHQTLRTTSLDTRFQIACFGVLGYECNLVDLSKEELELIKQQVMWYKKYRKTLQYGEYYRIMTDESGRYQWMVVSKDRKTAIGLFFQTLVEANYSYPTFHLTGLDENKIYRFTNRHTSFNIKEFGDLINSISPVHIRQDSLTHNLVAKFMKKEHEKEEYILSGSVLNKVGVQLQQGFVGTGYEDGMRLFQDFASRIYVMEEVEGNVQLMAESLQ
ncbi:MAG: alpha-galactosidase [Eubacteriales bacterium]